MSKKIPKIVVIGGGTGIFSVLSALKNEPVSLTAIVSMADSGGSTGRLRNQYGVLPPGDVRRSLIALSNSSQTLRDLFTYRFKTGDLRGHNFGNIFLSTFEKITGNFNKAIKEASGILNLQGRVMPVTLVSTNLYAKLYDGQIIKGEANIDIPKHNPKIPIEKVWLSPQARINPEAKKAILSADTIIIGPGDIYTSILPNLLVRGASDYIKKSKAKKIYICNLMTKLGETNNWSADNFINEIEKYLGKSVLNFAIFNNKKPSAKTLNEYKKGGALFIKPPAGTGLNIKYVKTDLLEKGKFIRHDSGKKLVKVISALL